MGKIMFHFQMRKWYWRQSRAHLLTVSEGLGANNSGSWIPSRVCVLECSEIL